MVLGEEGQCGLNSGRSSCLWAPHLSGVHLTQTSKEMVSPLLDVLTEALGGFSTRPHAWPWSLGSSPGHPALPGAQPARDWGVIVCSLGPMPALLGMVAGLALWTRAVSLFSVPKGLTEVTLVESRPCLVGSRAPTLGIYHAARGLGRMVHGAR